jgi:hypothetical protein
VQEETAGMRDGTILLAPCFSSLSAMWDRLGAEMEAWDPLAVSMDREAALDLRLAESQVGSI